MAVDELQMNPQLILAEVVNWPAASLSGSLGRPRKAVHYSAGALLVLPDGTVGAIGKLDQVRQRAAALKLEKKLKTVDRGDYLLFPGLVDAHTHLPQLPAIGLGDDELLPWLKKYIFPAEKKCKDPEYTKKLADIFFQRLLAHGTTTAVVYGPAYGESTHVCFESAHRAGIRGLIGQTLMDRLTYRPVKAATLLGEVRETIEDWHGRSSKLGYIVTPRYALGCSPELMQGAGWLANEFGLHIQTHLSENQTEIIETLKAFPKAKSYADVYDQHGLLNERTLLGHCLHLSKAELRLLAKRGSAVVYCPTSNLFLKSGVLHLNKVKDLPLLMATDVAGGPDLSMLETVKVSVAAQNARYSLEGKYRLFTPSDHLFLASGAGAGVLDKRIGHLNPGAWADFFLVKKSALAEGPGPNQSSAAIKSVNQLLARLIYQGSRPIVRETWVGGQCVYQGHEF